MAYKVFTNGSVLNASEINENLMNQAVISFSSSTARAAAIPSPIEGMLTWLQDVNRYEYRNGAGAWVALAESGLNLLADQAVTAVTSLIIDNVFNATYDSYQMVITATASGTNNVEINFRAAGVNASTAYTDQYMRAITTGVTAARNTAATTAAIGRIDTNGGIVTSTIHGVALAQRTYGVGQSVDSTGVTQALGYFHTTATAYDGIRFQFTNSTTGRIRIYGLRNS